MRRPPRTGHRGGSALFLQKSRKSREACWPSALRFVDRSGWRQPRLPSRSSRCIVASAALIRTATWTACGTIWWSRSSRFASNSLANRLTPVRLPLGRLRLSTSPRRTGSSPTRNTTGIVLVAPLAASAAEGPPDVMMTAGLRRTRSAASSARRSSWLLAQRYSIFKFSPSENPTSFKPWWNALRRPPLHPAIGCPGSQEPASRPAGPAPRPGLRRLYHPVRRGIPAASCGPPGQGQGIIRVESNTLEPGSIQVECPLWVVNCRDSPFRPRPLYP